MREIVFDTETTGLDPQSGDRIVEIGCIELINHISTGEKFHRYVNPERDVPADAVLIHGLERSFLADKPRFGEITEELRRFLGESVLIAHNASFDMNFLNAELARAGRPAIADSRVIDTLTLARRRHPGSPASLDALCARYQIDTSQRTLHGALLDAELLSEVYIELIGGRQPALVLGAQPAAPTVAPGPIAAAVALRPMPRMFAIADAEQTAHEQAVEALGKRAIWRHHLSPASENYVMQISPESDEFRLWADREHSTRKFPSKS